MSERLDDPFCASIAQRLVSAGPVAVATVPSSVAAQGIADAVAGGRVRVSEPWGDVHRVRGIARPRPGEPAYWQCQCMSQAGGACPFGPTTLQFVWWHLEGWLTCGAWVGQCAICRSIYWFS
jgi:hypothetical protein